MPVPLVIFAGVLLGLAFARSAFPSLSRGSAPSYANPAFTLSGAFALLVFAPIAGISVAMAPDWSLAYVINSQHVPFIIETLVVILAALLVPVGFLWGASLIQKRRTQALGRLIMFWSIGTTGVTMLLWRRLGTVGTFDQYRGDFGTHPLAGSTMGYVVLGLLMILGFATAFTLFALSKMGQATNNE